MDLDLKSARLSVAAPGGPDGSSLAGKRKSTTAIVGAQVASRTDDFGLLIIEKSYRFRFNRSAFDSAALMLAGRAAPVDR